MNASSRQPGFELRGVGVRRGDRWILRDIHWTVPAGSCAAILGPNGSGKSTLARVLAGYIWPTVGDVIVDGQHFGETDLNQLRHGIRLVQSTGPYDVDAELTARELVQTGLFGTIGLFDEVPPGEVEHADRLLTKVGLGAVREHKYVTLSSGERVRALIARALIHRPRLLLLDEPTAGLDLLAREQVLATVQSLVGDPEHSPTIVMITHHVEDLGPDTSELLLLDNGGIAAGGDPLQVLREEVLSKVYRCPLRIELHDGRRYVRVDPAAWKSLIDEEAR